MFVYWTCYTVSFVNQTNRADCNRAHVWQSWSRTFAHAQKNEPTQKPEHHCGDLTKNPCIKKMFLFFKKNWARSCQTQHIIVITLAASVACDAEPTVNSSRAHRQQTTTTTFHFISRHKEPEAPPYSPPNIESHDVCTLDRGVKKKKTTNNRRPYYLQRYRLFMGTGLTSA